MISDNKRKILIVEDEPLIAVATAAMLKKNGYDVVTAQGGEKALLIYEKDPSIELVLMDIDLGRGMSGSEAAEKILNIRNAPIVFLTAHSEHEMVDKVKSITRYGYVIKNSGDFVLLSSMEMAFELFESHEKQKRTSELLAESEKKIKNKLDSILLPESEFGYLDLADLIDTSKFQSISDDLYKATGMPVGIFNIKGDCLVRAGWQDICTRFHRVNSESRQRCFESDTILTKGVKPGECRDYKCKNNMRDVVTPIMQGKRHVGNIFLGQFLYDDEVVDIDVFRNQAARFGYNEEEYLEALSRVPRWSRDAVQSFLSYYVKFADMISDLSFSNNKLAKAVAERDRNYDEMKQKESILRLITDNMVELVFMMGTDLRFQFISPSLEKMLGYRCDELIGMDVMEHVHPDDREKIKDVIQNLIMTGSAKAEFRYKRKDGTYLWYESQGKVLKDEQGNITGAVVGSREITDWKNAMGKLMESEKRYRLLVEKSPLSIFLVRDGKYIYANPSAAEKLGYGSPREMKDIPVERTISAESMEEIKKRTVNAEAGMENGPLEMSFLNLDGKIIITESVSLGVILDDGPAIMIIAQDITERKKAELEIQNLLEQKEMLLREVHHRIKNNMNTIAGLLNLQSLSISDPAAIAALNDARGRVQNMMLIYDKLYKSADYKNLQVKEYFDNLVNDIVRIFPNYSRVSVTKKIDDFRLDSKILFTMGIIINELITNAFKYAFDGVSDPELCFSLSRNKELIEISVGDNGAGLPENVKIGVRRGFGLNLVAFLAEQLDGEMRINDLNGTVITVTFAV